MMKMKISTSILVSSVCLFVCVCVCSRPTRHNSTVLFTKLHSSHTGRHRSGEKLVKLSNFSVCGSGSRNRSKDSSTLRDGAFSTNSLTSLIVMKTLPRMHLRTRTSSSNFGTHPHSASTLQMQTPDPEVKWRCRLACWSDFCLVVCVRFSVRALQVTRTADWLRSCFEYTVPNPVRLHDLWRWPNSS